MKTQSFDPARNTNRPDGASDETTAETPAAIDRRVRTIAGRIVANPAADMEDLAGEARLSVSWMQQLFKIHAGECISAFILRHRILRAAHLLRTTNLRIKEIADHVGYTKTAPFDRMFTRMVGQSPGDYRATSETIPPLTCRDLLDFMRPSALLCPVCERCKQTPPAGPVE